MNLFPAIDLKGGQVVRLERGEMDAATVYGTDPAERAAGFAAAGCSWLHVVDLDGAVSGTPANAAAVEGILKATDLPVQLGGGIRDMARIEDWLSRGVRRVILGTVAVRDPDLVRQACRRFPGRVAIGIDARGGRVAVQGWAETSRITAEALAVQLEDAGAAAIIHTDIDRDGIKAGVNVGASVALAHAVETPVIASGGVGGIEDIRAVRASGVLAGVVAGRALYDGSLDIAEAVAVLGGPEC